MTALGDRRSRVESIRDVTLAAAIAAAGVWGLWWLSARGAQSNDSWLQVMDVPVTFEPRLMLGQPEAAAVIVVASDFQCPFCAAFATRTLPQIRTEFIETGKVALYFRHFIGPTHRLAPQAAAVAECAGTTSDFWRVHDQLFAAQPVLTTDLLRNLQDSLVAMDRRRASCPEAPTAVKEDNRWALQMGATGSPFFFFGKHASGGKVLLKYAFGGARPMADFRKVVGRLVD